MKTAAAISENRNSSKALKHAVGLARPAGVEPATCGLEVRCSIQLSYGRSGHLFRTDGASFPSDSAMGDTVRGKMARPGRFELPTPRFEV